MQRVAIATLVLFAAGAAGCGTSDDQARVRTATARFYAAIQAHDGAAACRQLSTDTVKQLESQSGKSCAEAVTHLQVEGRRIERMEVYATSAVVALDGSERAFLSQQSGDWKLSAVGCRPEPGAPQDAPLDCEVQA
jgi:hypothetical protein